MLRTETRIIDGQLMIRVMPSEKWVPLYNPVADLVNQMLALPEEDRWEVMGYFCGGCGAVSPCACQRDE